MPNAVCDIGLVGRASMGQNLVLNLSNRGYTVAVSDGDFQG
jgi:6-phosphogluconate dehydrogenase